MILTYMITSKFSRCDISPEVFRSTLPCCSHTGDSIDGTFFSSFISYEQLSPDVWSEALWSPHDIIQSFPRYRNG